MSSMHLSTSLGRYFTAATFKTKIWVGFRFLNNVRVLKVVSFLTSYLPASYLSALTTIGQIFRDEKLAKTVLDAHLNRDDEQRRISTNHHKNHWHMQIHDVNGSSPNPWPTRDLARLYHMARPLQYSFLKP